MEFEWDPAKSAWNARERNLPFERAVDVFLDPFRITFVDDRKDYGEVRHLTMGHIEDLLFVLIYTERPDTIRIISARRANKREEKRYVREIQARSH
jgi:uncharacterized DUF497 family protein